MDYRDHFDFMKNRNKFFTISIVLLIVGIIVTSIFGLNFGVDFKAGTGLDINVGQAVTKEKAEEVFTGINLKPSVVSIGGNNDHVSARFDIILTDDQIKQINAAMVSTFGDKVSQEVNTVSPDIARELGLKAIYAVAIASIAICIYVSIRFEWRFALAAIIAILHDACVVIAMFAIFRFEVNLPFLAAILTTIGYSINDKIVIFDRVRENLRFSKIKSTQDLSNLLNNSIWQTMRRNVYTVLTVLLAAICLFVFGSESIKLFALAKIIGLTSGAYSSICIASPLWYLLKNKSLSSKPRATAVKE
ncbi:MULTISPECIES: protein translocase subunit SecF [Paenibacillus]|uniref:Protein-export membrane protein SecF n=1 Tax=Paenibacillus baimaensis TaxID=2982185 RepID=A0ABT2UA72_9BACL|nr:MULTISPECIES: protein translocase subunit SecF [unclassified Paenibacillus]MCU6791525.1 protein translocase subunit SecF [Paenibacillus sp. WQ 127069]